MRPGPGLVVMALAFISGARRGSTNTSSKITQSPTAPPSPAPSSAASPLPPPPLPSSIVAAIHHRRAGGAGGGDDDDDARTTSSHHPHSPHEPHPTASILFPSFLGGGGLLTAAAPPAHPAAAGPYASLPLTPPPSLPTTPHRHPHQQQQHPHHPHQHRQPSPTPTTTTHQGGERTASAATAPDYDYGFAASAPQSAASGFGGFAFSFGGPPPALYVLPDHLPLTRGDLLASLDSHPQAGSPAAASSPTSRAARKRRALRRRRRRRRRRSATASAAADAEVGRRLDRAAGSGDFPPIDDIDNESDSASSGSGSGSRAAVDGLWVQFPSHSPDSSRSIDEDDILALVAEDDFLSEESFDRLTKLADETQKIADDLGEDDYSGGTESAGGDGGGGEGGGSGTDISIDGSGSGSGSSVDSASEQTTINGGGGGGGGGEGDAEPERPQLDDSRSLDIEVIENIYAANLVSSGHNEVTAVAATATASESRAASEEQRAAAAADARRSIFESLSPLTRLNPWISACDLAQPGTAPDLQGECSAGTLPVAWVDEGPGPPTCPISCGELRLHNKNNLNNNFNTNSNNNNNNNKFTTSNGNFKATKMRRDVNEKEQQQHQEQHERDEQQKHDMKLTTTKTPAITIMKTTASAAGQVAVAATITTPPKATPASAAATTTTATTTKRPSDNDGDDDDAEVMLMQQDDNGVQHTAAAVASATHHQSHDNNNIVKLRAGYRNGNGNSNNNNNNNNHHHDDNQNDNNYDWKFNEQPGERTSSGSGGSGSRTRHHTDNGRQAPQQQCLHYLGDTEQTAPEHLCSMRSPSEMVARLRTIRLRHCCERNVFTALHTVALNVTLGGGAPCVRILSDIMELDSLASRITCELAEILFRFDCRQVYSMINQCDDCKEAYRRWVCSTLVPYFAEPGDVTARPGNEPTRPKAEPAKKQREAASTPPPHRSPSAAANNSVAPTNSTAPFASSAATAARKQQEIKNLYTGNMSSNNKPQHAAFNYEHKRQKRYISGSSSQGETGSSSLPPSYYGIMNRPTQSTRKRRRRCPDGDTDNDYSDDEDEQGAEDEDGLQPEDGCRRQQSDNNNNNNFQTTANSEDPRNTDPVISKLLKRTKRKVEFRKRRRIRPCLSVCQTVERKCPYLLPADRAPALPTQYAGEPTFLCLDQNIPETGEQLRKSGHGPSECCYEFCDNLMDGLCTYCNEFAAYEEADANAVNNNNTTSASGRLHNITMHPSEPQRFDTRLRLVNDTATNTRFASISIALRNDSDGADAATAMSRATLERLPYFAHYDGLYYYDDLSDDMPTEAVSEHCPQVPSVSTRCTIPYYATSSASSALLTWAGSSTAAAEAERRHLWHSQRLLIWLSALLCLLSSYNASQCRPAVGRRRRPNFCLHRENETEERGGRDVPQLAAGTVPGAIFHLQSNMSKPATIVALVLEVSGGRALHGRVDFTRSARRLMRRRRREGGARVRHGERERERVRHGGRERVREYLQNSRCNDLINFSQIHFSCRSKWKSIYYRSRCNRNFSLSPRPRDSSHLTAYAVTINIITTTRTESKNNNNNKINSKNKNNMKIENHNQNNSGKMKPPPPQSQPSSSIVTVTPKANSLHFVPCDWPHCRIAISNLTYRRYLYFYYLYNFNINDWWRRWGKRKVPPSAADTLDAAQRTKRRLHPHKFSPLAQMRQRTTWSL